MRLQSDDSPPVEAPSPEQIDRAVTALAGQPDRAVAVTRDDESFLQVQALDDDRVALEYCDFAADRSGRCESPHVELPTAAEAMKRFAAGDPAWRERLPFYDVRLVDKKVGRDETPEGLRELLVRQEYRATLQIRWITLAVAANAAAAWALAILREGYERWVFATVAVVVSAAAVGLHRLSHRCPSCGARLGLRRRQRCPRCNTRLR